MKKIRSILIDDEVANLNVLESMLKQHCPVVDITASAQSALEGCNAITTLQPELVFLDIKMPETTGFDMLRMLERIDFHVIFISAFDQYAIQAFEFNAVDYILKPIDYAKLVKAVNKVAAGIEKKDYGNVVHFIHSLDEKSQLIKSISLHQHDKVHVVDVNEICFVQALRGYSEIVTLSNQKLLSPKPLADYEELLSPFPNFLRVNKSVLINIDYIKDYTKGAECFITLRNHENGIEVSRRKKSDILQYLKRAWERTG